jgi:hypothetical protein
MNHYGIHVDKDTAITGVAQNNHVLWLDEELTDSNAIDLAWEEHLAECKDEDHDRCGPQERGDMLIGSWKKDEDGKYEPDETGEYAAIVREFNTQVVWSKHTRRVALCSPCYPGQGDLDTPGEYLAFDLPPELYKEY